MLTHTSDIEVPGELQCHRDEADASGVPATGTGQSAAGSQPWNLSDLMNVARVRCDLKDGKAKRLRQAAGISQETAAVAIGVKRSCFAHWEDATRAPDPDHALALAGWLRRIEVSQ